MRHAGQVVTRTMLLESVWEYHFDPQTNVIDVHISRLRAKIDKGFEAPLLHTVRGAGYMIRARLKPADDAGQFRLLRTQAFRIVLVYVLLFAFSVSGAAVLHLLEHAPHPGRPDRPDHRGRNHRPATSNISSLGCAGLVETRDERARCMPGQALYLLADGLHRVVAGNLDSWPQITDRRPAISSSSTMSGRSTASWRRAAPAAGVFRWPGGFHAAGRRRMCMTAT